MSILDDKGQPIRNQILCMDALELMRALPDGCVDLIFCDPPYDRDSIPLYGLIAENAKHCLKDGGFLLAMSGGSYLDQIMPQMSKSLTFYWLLFVGLTEGARVFPQGTAMPLITHQKPILAYMKGRGKPRTVLHDMEPGAGNDKLYHRWGQDLKSARYYIDCFTKPGDLVVDPLVGGGTTAVVCQALGRDYICCDLDRTSVETARARLRNPLYTPQTNGQLTLKFAR